uniref:Uncharacterized protein n=1 Tax=Palpitomonas bilix TaxID=652834 RepID=A0A7S3D016_9EUKA|mmetsp:Transcript_16297/g.41313  ORF Transcript_16297/g.41313 Transcript_16297/m.41313 type:complete len:210 (+) Transcript_16297:200-829(+)
MSAAGGIGKVNVYKAGRDINEMSAAEKARMEAEIAKTLGEVPNNGRKSMTMKKMPAPPAKVMGTVRPGSASAAKSNPVTPRDIAQVMAAKGVGLFSGSKSGGVHRPKPQARAPPPPKAGAFKERKFSGRDTLLKKFYLRGDLPVAVLHKPNQNQLKWKVGAREGESMLKAGMGMRATIGSAGERDTRCAALDLCQLVFHICMHTEFNQF